MFEKWGLPVVIGIDSSVASGSRKVSARGLPIVIRIGSSVAMHSVAIGHRNLAAIGDKMSCRSLLEMVYEAAIKEAETGGQEKSTKMIGDENRLIVTVPACVIDTTIKGNLARTPVTFTEYTTGNIMIECTACLETRLFDHMTAFERFYAGCDGAPPDCMGLVMAQLRTLPWSATLVTKWPKDTEFESVVSNVAETVDLELKAYPAWKAKLLAYLTSEFGLGQRNED